MKKKVAVIGAGLSGLTTIKQLLDEGHEVTCFEQSADYGGVFNKLNSCYDSLTLTVSNYFMAYSDFVPSKERYRFWNKQEYRQYLERYVEKFNILPSIKFEQEVNEVKKVDGVWQVTSSNSGKPKSYTFDSVAICSGMFVHKKIPEVKGLDTFDGEVIHTKEYTDANRFKGKRVLCVGMGESSSDVTSEISSVASQCYLSLRRYPAMAPKFVPFQKDQFFTIDASWNTVRNFNNIPKIFHKQLTGGIFKKYLKSNNPDTRLRGEWIKKSGPPGNQVINKNERVFTHIVDGQVIPNMTGIKEFDKTGVTFNDGTRIDIDAVVFCTGYKITFPFLKDVTVNNVRDLYLQMFNTDEGKDLAFIGFARPQQGGVPAIAELQARYFSLLCSDKKQLPSQAIQHHTVIKHTQHWEKEYSLTPKATGLVNYCHYMDLIAEKVGCLPEKPSMLNDPLLRIKLDYNPIFCAQYRLNGPHSNPEETKAFLKAFPNTFSGGWISYLIVSRFILRLLRNTNRIKLLKAPISEIV
jgi:dimethylaniline monooxygenase (N-oxide forming)